MHTFVKQEQTVMIKTDHWMKGQIICFEKNKKWVKLYIGILLGDNVWKIYSNKLDYFHVNIS